MQTTPGPLTAPWAELDSQAARLEATPTRELFAQAGTAEVRDDRLSCEMTVEIVAHLARLRGQKPPTSVGNFSRSRPINLLSQQ